MTLTIDLGPELELRLAAAARDSGVTPSEFALKCVAERLQNGQGASPVADERGAWELGKSLFGKHGSGRPDLSERDEEMLRAKLRVEHNSH